MDNTKFIYPKQLIPLTAEQQAAREQLMYEWHLLLPKKYSVIEKFNHGFPSNLFIEKGWKTLEIGAGLGEHYKHESIEQDYYCLEYRKAFCDELCKILPESHIIHGDIEKRQEIESGSFDRIVAVHVLEHLRNLPAALIEINRILKRTGVFDIVIPCEGSLMYSIAREISAKRLFKKLYPHLSYGPIIKSEHVSEYDEILNELNKVFEIKKKSFFPLPFIPLATFNLCVGLRLEPKKSENN